MDLEFRKISHDLGAESLGADLSKPLDDRSFGAIHRAFLTHGILLFREQHAMGPEEQIAFSRRLGRIEETIPNERMHDEHPILVLSNIVRDGEPVGSAQGGQFWHSDLYYNAIPAAASFLHALIVPEEGGKSLGDTKFANMAAAHDALPEAVKNKIDGLKNRVSRVKSWPINYPFRPPLTEAEKAAYASVVHPLVRTHPETGRKSLFIGDISAGTIVGMPADEGDALLRELRDFATQPRFTYVHRWAVGDAILWDNRSTVHAATDFDAEKYERLMHRTTIMDDTVPV
jgi:taurine dioxygenase